ncbi:MAG: sugar ABC transporter ATP-binding protein, partial [Mesorhizobium sp.]
SWTDRLDNISLTVSAGEVVGLGGLDGQGQRELLLAFFGVLRGLSGQILIDGRPVAISSPAAARDDRIGMALIPEDRKTEGLMLPMTVRENLSFAALDRLSRAGIIDRAAEQRLIDDMVALLAIKTAGLDIPVGALSGGNQQKVVIAKWLATRPRVLLLDEPTRGIDVGAKADVFRTMRKLSRDGLGILFATSDLDEVMALSDRIAVMSNGKLTGMFDRAEATEAALVAASALGHGPVPHTENRP